MDTVMIIIWAVVIAAALLVEFLTCDFLALWFIVAGAVALILAAFKVAIEWQVLVFFIVSIVLVLSLRPIAKKLFTPKTVPMNLDANIGKVFKLTSDVKDGKSTIVINQVTWTVTVNGELKTGERVKITDMSGNRYIAVKAEDVKKEEEKK